MPAPPRDKPSLGWEKALTSLSHHVGRHLTRAFAPATIAVRPCDKLRFPVHKKKKALVHNSSHTSVFVQ